MLEKIKKLFKRESIHPVVNTELSTAIDDKLSRRNKDAERTQLFYQKELNNYVLTYFSKQYRSRDEMGSAFEVSNKAWIKLCREVNSSNRLISLEKDAFQKAVKSVISQKKQENEISK